MLFFHAILSLFLLAIFFYDLTRYIIPNWICGILLALYPAMLLLTPSLPEGFSIWWSVGILGIVFCFGVAIFALRLAGGGDVKLLAVLSLWTGREATIEFLFYTGLLGGALALFLLLVRPIVGRFVPLEKQERIPRILCYDAPLPYGLAITVSFAALLWTGEIPGLPVAW